VVLEVQLGKKLRVAAAAVAARVNIINYFDSFKKLQRFCQYSIPLQNPKGV